jgi:hypothetical protein
MAVSVAVVVYVLVVSVVVCGVFVVQGSLLPSIVPVLFQGIRVLFSVEAVFVCVSMEPGP